MKKKNRETFLSYYLIGIIVLFFHSASALPSGNYIRHSKLFVIQNHQGYKVLSVINPTNNNDTLYTYVLANSSKTVPINLRDRFIKTPVKRVICLSSIYVGLLERLGYTEKVIAVDNFNYISNQRVMDKREEGLVTEVGETRSLDYEKIIELNPDIIFTYGNGSNEEDYINKLSSVNINISVLVSHFENTPLARAEWIKFIAAFFNEEEKAEKLFNETEASYNNLKLKADDIKEKPTVFTEAMYGGIWYAPGGRSYVSNFISDAGGQYIFNDDASTGSLRLSFEVMLEKAIDADCWINTLSWKSLNEIKSTDERYAVLKAFKIGNVFNNNFKINEAGGNPYWEVGSVNPDLILSDLIKIFHPNLLPEMKFNFYHKLK